jgi:GTP:adenosylcobinamide-phosphate guanylyltransferase
MDAIVTAGGIPKPDEPLYPYTQGQSKALLDVAGKPMIQWVLDALGDAETVERVILIGLPPESLVKSSKPLTFMKNQGSMMENIRAGVVKLLEVNPKAHHVLIVSSDIPAITADMVDWVVNTTMQYDEDAYYNVISKEIMEARFPGSKRTYTRLKDISICGGDMNVMRTMTVTANDELWRRLIASRKNVLKQAALIGYGTLFLILLRRLTLQDVVKRVTKRLQLTGRAIICPYAEVGMDIDKPHQLELLRADLAKRV